MEKLWSLFFAWWKPAPEPVSQDVVELPETVAPQPQAPLILAAQYDLRPEARFNMVGIRRVRGKVLYCLEEVSTRKHILFTRETFNLLFKLAARSNDVLSDR